MSGNRQVKLIDEEDVDFGVKRTGNTPHVRAELSDQEGEYYTVHNPLPINEDTVYCSDVNLTTSNNGNFTGEICDYFNSLTSVNTNSTTNNPKKIIIAFEKSLSFYSLAIGCNDLAKNFSNVKILIYGSANTLLHTIDYSADSTKRNSQTFAVASDIIFFGGNTIVIEFHTSDPVSLSNIFIQKSKNTNSRIQAVNEITDEVENIKSRNGNLNVSPEYKDDIPADYYLYQTIVTPTITSDMTIGDTVVNVDDTTGIVVGHAITFYENISMYQSIVKATTATTITLSSPIDYAFTTAALVETGLWNMAVDGSVTPQTFKIKAPQLSDIHIHTINCSILSSDPYVMDDGKFGGITALTNGTIFKFINGITKNLALVVNNLGFWEIGFSTSYADKAPSGQYGFKARRDLPSINGIILALTYSDSAEFQIIIQDDLTDLDLFACTINGHMTPYH